MARICVTLAWVTGSQGNAPKAIEIALRGLKMVEGTEHAFEIGELCAYLVAGYGSYFTDMNRMFEYAQKMVEVAQKSGNSYQIAHSLFWLGDAYMYKGEDKVAIQLMKESLEIYRKIGHNFGMGQCYSRLIDLHSRKGDWDGVIEWFEGFSKLPSHPWYKRGLHYLAFTYLQKGDERKPLSGPKRLWIVRCPLVSLSSNVWL
jgi:tetratricopeptide (TPR) repeat protein